MPDLLTEEMQLGQVSTWHCNNITAEDTGAQVLSGSSKKRELKNLQATFSHYDLDIFQYTTYALHTYSIGRVCAF